MRDDVTKERIIRLEITVEGDKVKCRLNDKAMENQLMGEDERYQQERVRRDKEAKSNQENQGKGNPLTGEKFVHVHPIPIGAKSEKHATIHLFTEPGDQIEWFTEDPRVEEFTVSIQRNPELVQVLPNTSIDITPNVGIDNPFVGFPKDGLKGGYKQAPKRSGVLRKDDGYVFLQRYYKYTVRVGDKYQPFDPDVEGHYGS